MDRSWVYRVITYSLITLAALVMLAPTFAAWTGHSSFHNACNSANIRTKRGNQHERQIQHHP